MKMSIFTYLSLVAVWTLFGVPFNRCNLLFPFGRTQGDRVFTDIDDDVISFSLATPYRFFGTNYNKLFVSPDGFVAFERHTSSVPPPTISKIKVPIIAVFYNNLFVPFNNAGLFIRESSNVADIQKAEDYVTELFPDPSPFTPTSIVVVTWDNFIIHSSGSGLSYGECPCDADMETLTFQTALVSSTTVSVALFMYENLNSSDGEPLVGVNANDRLNFREHCFSSTIPDVLTLDTIAQKCTIGLHGFITEKGQPTTCQTSSPECPALTNPTNGRIIVSCNPSTGEKTAIYTCNDSYVLQGNSSRTCEASGQWSEEEPVCIKECPALTNPTNGRVIVSNTPSTVGNTATYTCNDGYVLQGNSQRTCEASGQWSEEEPVCIKECPALTSPTNGMVIVSNIPSTVGNTVTYTCNDSYILQGNSSRTCEVSGQWSEEEPVCLQQVANLETCLQADACADVNSVCNGSSICDCKTGFILDSSNACVPYIVSIYCVRNRTDSDLVDVFFTLRSFFIVGLQTLTSKNFSEGVREVQTSTQCRSPIQPSPATLSFTVNIKTQSNPGCGVEYFNDTLRVIIESYQEFEFHKANDLAFRLQCNILPSQLSNGVNIGDILSTSVSARLGRTLGLFFWDRAISSASQIFTPTTVVTLGRYIFPAICFDRGLIYNKDADPYGCFAHSCFISNNPKFDTTGDNFSINVIQENGCPNNTWLSLGQSFKVRSGTSSSSNPFCIVTDGFQAFIWSNGQRKLYMKCRVGFCTNTQLYQSSKCHDSCANTLVDTNINDLNDRRKRDTADEDEQEVVAIIEVAYLEQSSKATSKVKCVNPVLAKGVIWTLTVLLVLATGLASFMFYIFQKKK